MEHEHSELHLPDGAATEHEQSEEPADDTDMFPFAVSSTSVHLEQRHDPKDEVLRRTAAEAKDCDAAASPTGGSCRTPSSLYTADVSQRDIEITLSSYASSCSQDQRIPDLIASIVSGASSSSLFVAHDATSFSEESASVSAGGAAVSYSSEATNDSLLLIPNNSNNPSNSITMSDSLHLDSAASLLMLKEESGDGNNSPHSHSNSNRATPPWPSASAYTEASTEVVLSSPQQQTQSPAATELDKITLNMNQSGRALGFSQLLDQADDQKNNHGDASLSKQEQPAQQSLLNSRKDTATNNNSSSIRRMLRSGRPSTAATTQLPVVTEETDSVIVPTSEDGSSSGGSSIVILAEGEEYDSQFHEQTQQRMQAMLTTPRPRPRFLGVAAATSYRQAHEERSLAALAGATTTTTGPDSFSVSVEVAASQGVDDDACSSVLDILANPEMLPLWCSAVDTISNNMSSSQGHRLVVVRRSEENISNNIDHRRGGYDGEWVEATAPLALPPASGCVVRWTTALGRLLGGSCYGGRIQIFVERPAGRVSLTLGPFPGNVQVCHRLQVVEDASNGNGRIRIQDSVRLQRGNDEDDDSGCLSCGLLEHCFLPTMQDYKDQTLTSLARLRFLVERRGEQQQQPSVYASTATSPNESDFEMQSPLLMTA